MSKNYALGKTSKQRLIGVHPDLVAVVELAIKKTKQDFSVVEGLRTRSRQAKLYKAGKSKTMNSRHITGHAVDISPYPFNGDKDGDGVTNIGDWDQYWPLRDAMFEASKELSIPIEWGGNWKAFKDGPHWQLPRKGYP